jgi:hypothetical protein
MEVIGCGSLVQQLADEQVRAVSCARLRGNRPGNAPDSDCRTDIAELHTLLRVGSVWE